MIRVFVGCAANTEDAESQAVLEHTLRKYASEPVHITWMRLSKDPTSPYYSDAGKGWRTERWATPFSGFRWAIPAMCGWQGRAIYSDSDVIYQADVAELWRQELLPGKVVLAKGGAQSWRYCVSLWDCERARGHVDTVAMLQADPMAHDRLGRYFASRPELTQQFAGDWNCLDGKDNGGKDYPTLDDPAIKAIHYTDMGMQPHLPAATRRLAAKGLKHWFNGRPVAHRRKDMAPLFARLLREAEEAGFPVSRYEDVPMFGPYKKADLAGYKGR